MKLLVSACLLGVACRYDGRSKPHPLAQELCRRTAVPCTACHYCVEKCPQNLDIPALLALFNAQLNGEDAAQRIAALPEDRRPQSCRACRSCEKVCPQGIRISAALGQFSHLLHG